MYARCPTCETLFRIRAQQLKAARGQVRCGVCQTTFDALEFLVNQDELSETELRTTSTVSDREVRQWHLPFDNEPPLPLFSPPVSEELAAGSGHELLSAAQIELLLTPEANDTPPDTQPLDDEPPPPPAAEMEEIDYAPPVAQQTEDERQAHAPALARPPSAGAPFEPVSQMEAVSQPTRPRYALPEEELPPLRSTWGQIGWGLASLLLLALLGGQVAYINRDSLAKDPTWRPWLEQGCTLLDCALPTQRDLGAVEMVERSVLSHPQYQKALLITATLVNKAPFAQPYPEVELTMTDLEQKSVAQRRFLPREYLSDANPATLFPAGATVRLSLELADPGEEAVGFEFDFY